MANCELCGNKQSRYNAEIEGTIMSVCEDCSRFGKVKNKSHVQVIVQDYKKPEKKETVFRFIPGYGMRVKNSREKLGLKQEEMAKRLNERESTLHQIESEHLKPSIELARKLEKAFHIKILEEESASDDLSDNMPSKTGIKKQASGLTIGDMIRR